MNTENFIESQFRLLDVAEENEFSDLYLGITNQKLAKIFGTLHKEFVDLFKSMNTRLPTGPNSGAHFWAEPSRKLISSIEMCERLERALKESLNAFSIDSYYQDVFGHCKKFLTRSGGSTIPPSTDEINVYYTVPMFIGKNTLKLQNVNFDNHAELKLIGEGSYAQVFKFSDKFYEKTFALKRAKKILDKKEIERFKREFDEMRKLCSPYVVEVFRYFESSNEYVMEFIDKTLDKYISANNTTLSHPQRKNIGNQILRGFAYIHSKGVLHRDISPKNILIKEYEGLLVVKISDFGLVKISNSDLTSASSELKGYFNDPVLSLQGFDAYAMLHETYALTRLLFYVMTGKTNTERINDGKLKEFVVKGINPEMSKRFKNTEELSSFFKNI